MFDFSNIVVNGRKTINTSIYYWKSQTIVFDQEKAHFVSGLVRITLDLKEKSVCDEQCYSEESPWHWF